MAQVSWRADDALVEQVRRAAKRSNRSLNEYITVMLSAVTDPDLAGTEAAVVRERLALAGLLEEAAGESQQRPSKRAVVAAGRRAATGTPLHDVVSSGR